MSDNANDNESISVQAFKSMIEGMDMIGGDDWSPNPEQWKRIREKIRQLEEGIQAAPQPAAGGHYPAPVVNSANPWENGTGNLPGVSGGVPPGDVVMGASTSALTQKAPTPTPTPMATGNPAAPMAMKEGQQVKTPDIDSSTGYDSPFA